jgi:gamma-glutamyltranspeptidase/glutathione hydrolase
MHDFNVKPGLTNDQGLIGTVPNRIEPGKRMLSSMSPILVVKDGKPRLVTGSPGGRTIINTVMQVTLNVIDHEMDIQQAVEAGRVHHQWLPDRLMLEARIPQATAEALRKQGHEISRRATQGDAHSILIDSDSGAYRPGIDRRRSGAAFGF